jgi:TPR repeat protein
MRNRDRARTIPRALTSLLVVVLSLILLSPANAGSFEVGKAAYDHADYATALKYWQPLAEQGQADAQNGLGVLYWFGFAVPRDQAKAIDLFRRSAKQGFAKAQGNLSMFLDDAAEALSYAGLAAQQGDPRGEYMLGNFYYHGKGGVPVDYAKALAALTKAGTQGFRPAQVLLGELYAYGLGPTEDHARAYAWYKVALENERANDTVQAEMQEQLDRLIGRSTTAEINAGQLLAERCIHSAYQDCGQK